MRGFLGVLLVLISISFCQGQKYFGGGFQAGIVASQVDGDKYAGYNRIGLSMGFFIDREINDKFDLNMELKYIQKGSSRVFNKEANAKEFYKLRLNYMELPFLLIYKYKEKISFFSGLSLACLIGTKEENEYGELPKSDAPSFNFFDFNGIIGMKYFFNSRFSIDARFAYSIVPIRKFIAADSRYFLNRGQYNNLMVFSIFYHLNR